MAFQFAAGVFRNILKLSRLTCPCCQKVKIASQFDKLRRRNVSINFCQPYCKFPGNKCGVIII